MNKGKVIITITPDGSAQVEAEGIQGDSCTTHTKPFIDALGDAAEEVPKPEMFETPEEEVDLW